jgi:8-oxo-dGTP pyrophosphatase MutT (NUDIX family)
MPGKVHTSKVLCYIVRDDQLLVFRHADYDPEHVGIQVPAGSMRHGESPEDAALREAREETGLRQFSIARKLGEAIYDCSTFKSMSRLSGGGLARNSTTASNLPHVWSASGSLCGMRTYSRQARAP